MPFSLNRTEFMWNMAKRQVAATVLVTKDERVW